MDAECFFSLVEFLSMTSTQTSGDDLETIHLINITNGSFPSQMPDRIECGDTMEFQTDENNHWDIYQVYQDGKDFYRIDGGLELINVRNNTPAKKRRMVLSFNLHQNEIQLYFCIIPSNQREVFLKSRRCSAEICEKNRMILRKNEQKISLTDQKESQKVLVHKGDTVEFEWTSKRDGGGYRIEERKYCPISGGLYKVEQAAESSNTRVTSKGNFLKTFDQFGTSFFFRLTETNQIHDIIVCIIKDKYRFEHIQITDTDIQPNVIQIEEKDFIVFEWNTKEKQTMRQMEPFSVDRVKQQSIEVGMEVRRRIYFVCFLVENPRKTFLLAV